MTKIAFLTNGINTPSSRFRVYQFLEQIQGEFEYRVDPSSFASSVFGSSIRNILAAGNMASGILAKGLAGDRFFIQRMLLYRNNVSLERLAFSCARNGVVVDFDDAIFLGNPNFSHTVGRADLVIAGNAYLADWASSYSSNIRIIPTCVDHLKYRMDRAKFGLGDREITVGWTGTKDNLNYLESIAKPLIALHRGYGFKILLISDSDVTPDFLAALPVEHLRWEKAAEIEQLGRIDIGLMPLPDNDWARGKCGFKLLQYMASGALAIGSSVGANTEIISDGDSGFLCESPDDWYSKIEWSLKNFGTEKYRRIVNAGVEKVASEYSVEAHITSFVDAVTNLR